MLRPRSGWLILKSAILGLSTSSAPRVIIYCDVYSIMGEATITSAAQIQGIELSEYRGRQALVFTLDSGTFEPARLTTIDILGPNAPDTLFDHARDDLLKASWNWLLVHNDRSKGLHNPSYSTKVLEAAIGQL